MRHGLNAAKADHDQEDNHRPRSEYKEYQQHDEIN